MAASAGITVTFNSASIGPLVDVSHSGMNAGTVEHTHQGSTATNGVIWRVFEPSGFADGGEYTFEIRASGLLPAIGTQANLVIDFTPLSKTWTWTGAIYTGYDTKGPMASELNSTVKFKLSGIPVIS